MKVYDHHQEKKMLRERAIDEMKQVFAEVPYGIRHTLRVLANADEIMAGEGLDEGAQEVVALAAILHDIGALEAQRKHGSMEGHFQELEGPALAREILTRIGAQAEVSERVCFITGHHHTAAAIDGPDFQILWEADLLDSLENGRERPAGAELQRVIAENFRTAAGKRLALQRVGAPRQD